MYNQLSNLDRRLLKLLLESEGGISSLELSRRLNIPVSTVKRRRNHLEEEYSFEAILVKSAKVRLQANRPFDLYRWWGNARSCERANETQ